jgi:bifunctional non-homologous end joining protein LigD
LPSFRLLQEFRAGAHAIHFYAFDVLYLGGRDLRNQPLDTRRRMLRKTVASISDPIRLSDAFDVPAAELLEVVRARELEGVIDKRRDSVYQPGKRSGAWVKYRANLRQEFVVGGYVPHGENFDSILVRLTPSNSRLAVTSISQPAACYTAPAARLEVA